MEVERKKLNVKRNSTNCAQSFCMQCTKCTYRINLLWHRIEESGEGGREKNDAEDDDDKEREYGNNNKQTNKSEHKLEKINPWNMFCTNTLCTCTHSRTECTSYIVHCTTRGGSRI